MCAYENISTPPRNSNASETLRSLSHAFDDVPGAVGLERLGDGVGAGALRRGRCVEACVVCLFWVAEGLWGWGWGLGREVEVVLSEGKRYA